MKDKLAVNIDEDICDLIEKDGYKVVDRNSNWSDGKSPSENYHRIYKKAGVVITLNIFRI